MKLKTTQAYIKMAIKRLRVEMANPRIWGVDEETFKKKQGEKKS